MKLILPAQISPPRIRKDGSCSLSFDTRELSAEEIVTIMGMRNTEGWLAFAQNENELDTPDQPATLDLIPPSQRLRSVLFILYKQETDQKRFVGSFETFYGEKMEQLIQFVKNKIVS